MLFYWKLLVCDFSNGLAECQLLDAVAWTMQGFDFRYMFLCGDTFTSLPNTRCTTTYNSKKRALVHEWLHNMAFREDLYYDAGECAQIAILNQTAVILNAESYTLFYCQHPQQLVLI